MCIRFKIINFFPDITTPNNTPRNLKVSHHTFETKFDYEISNTVFNSKLNTVLIPRERNILRFE